MPDKNIFFEDDPQWYKDAIIYELHVKTFCDSNSDGIGDFRGLTSKLDYLEDLGITAIWLLPFYPSPLRDDGYDIADYFNVNPSYGTLRDFRDFLKEAHRRGLRVITELVLNHTSDQHAWFQKARKSAPGSEFRNYYVWDDNADKYQDTRIIFKDYESSNWAWDPVAKQYYWHRFYSHQPDLNFENTKLQKAVQKVLDFWFEMGIDGMRLDAVPYLYEKEGTNCENLPETYEYLKKLRKYLDGKYKNRMFLAEANQWPEDAVAYLGQGDLCHMAFHFPLMPRMFMAIQMEDRFPIIDILEQTPAIPDTCQWAMFLRNHDELTLEMVTDEERDYMYRIYAKDSVARINLGIRRRLAPLLDNHRRKIELMNILLLSFPGTPVIYYGDEIGMGDNYYLGDRDGVRTPMQWNGDRNAGFSRANPQKLYLPVIIDPAYHYEAVNVETQQMSSASLLWWMKQVIAIRKRFRAFGRGSIEFITPENPKILAYVRKYEAENILVAVNLSKHSQAAELDLTGFAGYSPEDVFSSNRFPVIKESLYMLTLAPFGYYVFLLKKQEETVKVERQTLPEISVSRDWKKIFEGRALERLEATILPEYLKKCRWFGGKSRTIREVLIHDKIPLHENFSDAYILFIKVKYSEGPSDMYLLPVSFASYGADVESTEEFMAEGMPVRLDYDWLKVKADKIIEESGQAVIASIAVDGGGGILYDSFFNSSFRDRIFEMIARKKRARGEAGEISAYPGRMFRRLLTENIYSIKSRVLKAEQTNTSVLYGNDFFFKFYRRAAEGINPDMEIIHFLTEKTSFANIPPFAGAIEYRSPDADTGVVGLLQGYVPNQGDTWTYMLDAVRQYFERILAKKHEMKALPEMPVSFLETETFESAPVFQEMFGGMCLEMADILGMRTAHLHTALSSVDDDPAFAPEQFSLLYQRSLYQSLRSHARKVFQSIGSNLKKLPPDIRKMASDILSREKDVLANFSRILKEKIPVTKTRIHGDYHLGQVLFTGKDYIIIDFEGEPARAIGERRLKKSPLVDIAGMLRSFHYAAYSVFMQHSKNRPEDITSLEPWLDAWYKYIGGVFLRSYLKNADNAPFIPRKREHLDMLIDVFLLEKAIYEAGYELNNRPEWLLIPFMGIKNILNEKTDKKVAE